MEHQHGCPVSNRNGFGLHSDAARRIADTFTLHRLADPYGHVGRWFAAKLEDGTSDNVLYDSKDDAVRHQHHNENYYTFIQIVPSSMTPCEAEVMLKTARMIYAAGARMTGGGSRKDLIRRLSWEDQSAQSAGIITNLQYGRMN